MEDACELAVDEDGNCITSESELLTNDDSHFICKECWNKVKKFCNIEESEIKCQN